LSRDLAAFDLRYPTLAHAHAVGDLLLRQASGAAHLSEAVSDHISRFPASTEASPPARATCSARISFQAM
jgi:hypothetical protein